MSRLLLQKKLNLLIHLAHIDGRFDEAERMVLELILRENGLEDAYLNAHPRENVHFADLEEMPDKAEVLYWVLQVIHADGVLHPIEISYARTVAVLLGYREDIIDNYMTMSGKSLRTFRAEAQRFRIQESAL